MFSLQNPTGSHSVGVPSFRGRESRLKSTENPGEFLINGFEITLGDGEPDLFFFRNFSYR